MPHNGFLSLSETIINHWPNGLIGLDNSFNITLFNPTAHKLLGYLEKDLLGQPLHKVLCSGNDDYCHDEADCPLHGLLKADSSLSNCEAWWITNNGDFTNVNINIIHSEHSQPTPLSDALAASNPDNNDADNNKDALSYLVSFNICPTDGFSEAQIHRLAQFADQSPIPIAEINASGSIEYANPGMMELMLEHGFDDQGHAKILPQSLEEIVKSCIQDKISIDSIEVQIGDHVFLWTFCPVKEAFPPIVHAYGQNISEIRNTQAKLETALKKAQVATETKSQFLANMSHEVRTPLTAIIGYAESIHDNTLTVVSVDEAIQTIVRNGRQMLQIINDILDISKIEAQRLQVEQIPTDIGEILAHVENINSLQATEKDLFFTIDVTYPIPKTITSDPVRVKQILFNLCSNALKFTHTGGVTVRICYLEDQHLLEFAVIDSGIGIPEDKAKNLFHAFSQADASTTRHYGGTGLGLVISKQLCEMLNGQLIFNNNEHQGSTFTATLSVGSDTNTLTMADNNSELFTQTDKKEVQSFIKLKGHVLLADDSRENRQLVSMLLSHFGLTVTEAENGEVAVECALETSFDLILMDIQMPEMDGLEATELLRQCGYENPIIALTANVMEDEIKHYLASGFVDCIGKPIDRQAMTDTLKKYLDIEDETPYSLPAITTDLNSALKENPIKTEHNEPTDQTDFYQSQAYQNLVNEFVQSLKTELAMIHSAVASEDWNKVQQLAHKLKGAGGSFGFDDITQIAEKIESALKQTENKTAAQLLPTLTATIQTTLQQNQ